MNELVEQVKNIDNSSILSSIDDISLDNNICLEYIDNWSIQLDIQIILKTVVVILNKVGSK